MVTFGHWVHNLQGSIADLALKVIPESLIGNVIAKRAKGMKKGKAESLSSK